QTVHRRGYRFLPPAATLPVDVDAAPPIWLARDSLVLVLPWAVAVLLGAAAASAFWRLWHPDAGLVLPVARFDVALPTGATLETTTPAVALAADGSRLVFSACAGDACRLFTRRMDDTSTRPLAGTDGGVAPFVSPDGAQVGFFADGKLKIIATAGGTAASV